MIGKPDDTGGAINLITAKEQLLYEVTDPRAYVTPDITADFTTVQVKASGTNRVAVSGATGKPRSPTLKVSIGYHAGYVGEGEISYAGANALQRAQLAGEVVQTRLKGEFKEMRVDYIGSTSLHGKAYDENDKVAFLSAGFEGAMISAAAVLIIYEAVRQFVFGVSISHLGFGAAVTGGAAVMNLLLGLSLIRVGKKSNSPLLRANGLHVLTDVWSSGAVLVALA